MAKTYNDIYLDVRKALKESGVDEYSTEARLMLAFAAGKTMNEFQRDMRLYAPTDFEQKADELLSRRRQGEPVAYITGCWEFFGCPFIVGRDVLIPRVDTEVVAETALRYLPASPSPRVLDLCSGSGCIGIAIARKQPETRIVLADISRAALKLARQNTLLNKVSGRVICTEADALLPPPPIMRNFDLMVCNPPYIPSNDIPLLDSSVRDYEPHLALDGGGDGLIFYRSVCTGWKSVLSAGARIVFECGIGQSEEVRSIGEKAGLTWLDAAKDTLGIERAIVFENKL